MASTDETPLAYPPEVLAKLAPGIELDRLVHTIVFKEDAVTRKKVPAYSSKLSLAAGVLEVLPMGMGRSQPGDRFYSDERPYWAGSVEYDAIFTSSSLPLVASKAAVYIAQVLGSKAKGQEVERVGE